MSTKDLKVLVSTKDYPQSGVDILKEHFTVLQTQYLNFGKEGTTKTREDLLKLIPGCSGLIWCSNVAITTKLLDAAGSSLKIVASSSAGFDHCIPKELKKRNIKLTNTPTVLSPTVAELAVGLVLAACRRFKENLQQVKTGNWEIGFDKVLGQDVRGSTVGIIGLGNIGQNIAKRLLAFEICKILYSGIQESPEGKALGAEFVTQNELLCESDIVVISVPLTKDTRHLINKESLALMKKNAILVNTARGDIIDQDALYNALKCCQIFAAGLDVTSPEPLPKDHKLLTLDNCFILPHIGSATERTRREMAELASKNVINELTGKQLLTPVRL